MKTRNIKTFKEDHPLSQSCSFSYKPHYTTNMRYTISKKKMSELFVKWITLDET